jgi:hypothetical protein
MTDQSNSALRLLLTGIFPVQVNNDYRGHTVALLLFIPLTLVTIARSLIHIFKEDGGAQTIATIPLDIYPAAAAQAIVTIFALWGLAQLLLGLFYSVVILRYRTLLPCMYLLVFIEYMSRHIIIWYQPIETMGTAPGGVINLYIAPAALILMLLALPKTRG